MKSKKRPSSKGLTRMEKDWANKWEEDRALGEERNEWMMEECLRGWKGLVL